MDYTGATPKQHESNTEATGRRMGYNGAKMRVQNRVKKGQTPHFNGDKTSPGLLRMSDSTVRQLVIDAPCLAYLMQLIDANCPPARAARAGSRELSAARDGLAGLLAWQSGTNKLNSGHEVTSLQLSVPSLSKKKKGKLGSPLFFASRPTLKVKCDPGRPCRMPVSHIRNADRAAKKKGVTIC